MQLTTVTWNIGGGKLLDPSADPTLLASYTTEGLDDIVSALEEVDADIITLQEVEGNNDTNQIAYIAGKLGLKHYFYDPTSDSHFDATQTLGNGLLSKHPISDHRTGYFHNPNMEFNLEGKTVKSHDKGYGTCLVDLGEKKIRATTLHLVPFRRVGIELDGKVANKIFESVTDELSSEDEYQLLQGDFNIDSGSVQPYLKQLFERNGLSEITLQQPTTPKNRKYDHVLFKGLRLAEFRIDTSMKTDHYPVICTFDL